MSRILGTLGEHTHTLPDRRKRMSRKSLELLQVQVKGVASCKLRMREHAWKHTPTHTHTTHTQHTHTTHTNTHTQHTPTHTHTPHTQALCLEAERQSVFVCLSCSFASYNGMYPRHSNNNTVCVCARVCVSVCDSEGNKRERERHTDREKQF